MPTSLLRRLATQADLASRAFFAIPQDGAVRGFYRVNRQEGRTRHVAILQTFAISPSEKGSGLARAMIEEAFAFYRRLGFEQEGLLRAASTKS